MIEVRTKANPDARSSLKPSTSETQVSPELSSFEMVGLMPGTNDLARSVADMIMRRDPKPEPKAEYGERTSMRLGPVRSK